ncbi:MAG: hypothetical protein KA715_04465 [Xanthomonadaceae bacterium]|nr:hypothetical protein [Xanthomonadaceae bacterium]
MKIRSWLGYSGKGEVFVNEKKGIFIVAKGFGDGLGTGEVEKKVIGFIREFLEKEAGDLEATLPFILRHYYSLAGNVIYNSILNANKKLFLENKSKPLQERMGCSVLVGLADQDIVAVANAGSTSLWLMRDQQIKEISTPKTYSRMVHPFEGDCVSGKDAPLIALGMNEELEPEISEYKIYHGDAVWMQTTGFKENIRSQIQSSITLQPTVVDSVKNTQSLFNSLPYSIEGAGALILF